MAKNGKKNGKNGKKNGLTPRNLKFIDNYINTGNATRSYIDAGYSPNGADVSSIRLLGNASVIEEVEKRRAEIAKRNDITSDKVINEIAKIAFANSEDFFDWDEQEVELIPDSGVFVKKGVALMKTSEHLTRKHKACIKSIEEKQHGVKLELYDKQKALDSLKQYLGVNNEAEIRKALTIKKGDTGKDGSTTSIEERIKEKMKAHGFDN